MVIYNPKDWFGLIFQFHKADTFRKLGWVMFSLVVFSAAVVFVEKRFFPQLLINSSVIHSLLGFVISLLLVFRTNTAYDRWWEGRKQWGALVNVSRNFAFKINAFVPQAEVERRRHLRDMTYSYAAILKDHLRRTSKDKLQQALPEFLKTSLGPKEEHIPNYLAREMQYALLEMHQQKEISEAAYLAMLQDLNAFTDICGACERIKKTPIPYTYNLFIKKFIFVYITTLPFAFAGGLGYAAIGVTVFVFYVLASLEMIAEEIEDPFGHDANDLPTDTLAETIQKNVMEIVVLEE